MEDVHPDNLKHPLDPPESRAELRRRRLEMVRLRAARRGLLQRLGVPTVREFYAGRHVFVTGASGFIGRVLVEKLLRSCPEIGNIYVLLRPRRGLDYLERLKALLDVPLFDRVRQEQPEALQKVVAMRGDCSELGLGLSDHDRQLLSECVSVVMHAAASVRFTDSVKKAVLLNIRGAREVVDLARGMKNLKVLVHVSTAYCFTNHNPTLERVYPTDHDWRDTIKAAELPDAEVLDSLGSKYLGFQPNTYVFSKALSERLMEDASEDLPVVIVRPSIVTCAIREPIPGWTDNLNGFSGFWAIACKGVLRVAYCPQDDLKLDLVPVDIVVKATILASWAVANKQDLNVSNPPVINIATSGVKPSTYKLMHVLLKTIAKAQTVVYPGAVRYPKYWNIQNKVLFYILDFIYHVLFGATVDICLVLLKQKPMLLPIYRRVAGAFQALNYFATQDFKFSQDGVWHLQGITHFRDTEEFNLDEADEAWIDIGVVQLKGVLQYALRETSANPDKDKAHVNRLWWAEVCLHALVAALGVWLCLSLWWR